MYGSGDLHDDKLKVTGNLEELLHQEEDGGSYELFPSNEIHGLRSRRLQASVHKENGSTMEDCEKIGSDLKQNFRNNNEDFQGSCEFHRGKSESQEQEEDLLKSTVDDTSMLNGHTNYEKLKMDHDDNNHDQGMTDECTFVGYFHVCAGQTRLLHVEQMPDHLKFNTYVHTGYRDLQNAWDCFLSMFYLHNETVNILTHLIPIFGVIYYWRSMFPWDDVQGYSYFKFLGWSHVIGSITPWLGSVTYHLFMNHHHGPRFYKFLLQLDMLGIWITQAFGALTNLTASTWCLSDSSQQIWLAVYAIASAWGLYKAVTAESALGRRMCFALCFISRLLGFMLRISTYGGGNPDIINHVILQDIISIVGGFIGVVRIPELWFPGRLDLFFNSHHIMHVMVVLAVYHMNWATNGDIRWMLDNYSKSQCVTLI